MHMHNSLETKPVQLVRYQQCQTPLECAAWLNEQTERFRLVHFEILRFKDGFSVIVLVEPRS